ncbi:hypothetical protein IKE99_00640, partial [Candidatus Saccharibacteria bacterium]|nr:hypothetical protein [Candidatus Saccharibacteria bacterium]
LHFAAVGAEQCGKINCQKEEDEKLVFQSSDDATICRRQQITTLRSSQNTANYATRHNKNLLPAKAIHVTIKVLKVIA